MVSEAERIDSIQPTDVENQKPGLIPSDTWGDTPVKKVIKSDSQKREKRQRTLSLKTKKPSNLVEYKGSQQVQAEMEGFLERKHELQKGRAKATLRSWKTYYTVLVGQLMCFFKDENDYECRIAAASPFGIHDAICDIATDYTKKKNVLRLSLPDGAEYLFVAQDQNEMVEWQKKIQHVAAQDLSTLPPALQLSHYDPDIAQSTAVSLAHSGSENKGPPSFGSSDKSENSPASTKKSITATLSDPFNRPTSFDASAQKDDHHSTQLHQLRSSDSEQKQCQTGHGSEATAVYPYQDVGHRGLNDSELRTMHNSTQSSRKSSASDVPPLPTSIPPQQPVYDEDPPADKNYDGRHLTDDQGRGYLSQTAYRASLPASSFDSGDLNNQQSGIYQPELYQSRHSQPHSEAMTLPFGATPTYSSVSPNMQIGQTTTLEYGTKPPTATKPDKDKKAKHGFFGGSLFGKSKKDKDAKK